VSSAEFLDLLLEENLLDASDWSRLDPQTRDGLRASASIEELLPLLVGHDLLTPYQADRLAAGQGFGLLLGNYRLRDRLAAGQHGIVCRADHLTLRRPVAIKVLPVPPEHARDVSRSLAVALTDHERCDLPGVVNYRDAGLLPALEAGTPALLYLVMDWLPGQDLEKYVTSRGALDPPVACDLIRQAARSLAAAHRLGLWHGFLQPTDLFVSPEGNLTLLDFGLARACRAAWPGWEIAPQTRTYLAPEQLGNPADGDFRSDLYALGAILFYCLTGEPPFDPATRTSEPASCRPPLVRAADPTVSAELEGLVCLLLDPDPATRLSDARELAELLESHLGLSADSLDSRLSQDQEHGRVLVADDDAATRQLCLRVLQAEGWHGVGAGTTAAAALAAEGDWDLLIAGSDEELPAALASLTRLRQAARPSGLPLLLLTRNTTPDGLARLRQAGADEVLVKPFGTQALQGRLRQLRRLRDAWQRIAELTHRLALAGGATPPAAREALAGSLVAALSTRDPASAGRAQRLPRYLGILLEETRALGLFAGELSPELSEILPLAATLHDVGKLALPDDVLLQPGPLSPAQDARMRTHTTLGAHLLDRLAGEQPWAQGFLTLARDLAWRHHERFDGRGYPDGLRGNDIPLAARLLAPCDVYDALRSPRSYRPGLSHPAALEVLGETWNGQFDPLLRTAFERCASRFERLYRREN
jgi:putative two-component system response regulator